MLEFYTEYLLLLNRIDLESLLRSSRIKKISKKTDQLTDKKTNQNSEKDINPVGLCERCSQCCNVVQAKHEINDRLAAEFIS